MTHVSQLEARFDGRIPANLLRAAEALDAAEARSRRPAVRIRRIHWKPEALVAQMARRMIEITAGKGCCEAADLLRWGFSAQQIESYGEAATHHAAALAGTDWTA